MVIRLGVVTNDPVIIGKRKLHKTIIGFVLQNFVVVFQRFIHHTICQIHIRQKPIILGLSLKLDKQVFNLAVGLRLFTLFDKNALLAQRYLLCYAPFLFQFIVTSQRLFLLSCQVQHLGMKNGIIGIVRNKEGQCSKGFSGLLIQFILLIDLGQQNQIILILWIQRYRSFQHNHGTLEISF